MLLFPLNVDVPMARLPWMNWLLILINVGVFAWQSIAPEQSIGFILGIEDATAGGFAPIDESAISFLVHMFMHAGFLHLVGNMVFLWVFGNAVCAKIGNKKYALVWIGMGLLAALAHVLTDDAPVIGASGAINGVVGMFLILYPINTVTMLFFFFVRYWTFSLASYWIILMWFAFDVLGFASDEESVAYAAHLGGFLGGAILAAGVLLAGRWEASDYERNLVEILKGN